MRLSYSPHAVCQLKEIKCFYNERTKDPSVARNIILQIENACRMLETYPDLGFSFAADDDGEIIRALPIGNYVALYRKDADDIRVVSIEDSRSDWKSLYPIERSWMAGSERDRPPGEISWITTDDHCILITTSVWRGRDSEVMGT